MLEMGGYRLISTISSHTVSCSDLVFVLIICIELYFTGRVDSTIFRIEATAPFSVTLSRHVPPFVAEPN